MISKFRTTIVAGVLGALIAMPSFASHDTYFGTIDAIDGDFGSGGGSFSGSLANHDDNAWYTFNASAGEELDFIYTATSPGEYVGFVIFRDVNDNGIIEVGDVADVVDFNSDRTGAGEDLEVQHDAYRDGCYCSYDQEPAPHTFTAPVSGQYVVGVASNNNSQGLDYQIELVDREVPTPVPAGSTWSLLLLVALIAGFGVVAQRRSSQAV